MDLEGIMFSEISKTEKAKYCVITFMCNLKMKKVVITQKRISQSLVSPCGSFSHLLAEFPSGAWRLIKPTNYPWASKI